MRLNKRTICFGRQKGTNAFFLFTRFHVTFVAVIYIVILHLSYVYIVVPNSGYMGYFYSSPPLLDIALAWASAIVPVLWMPVEVRRPSAVLYWILYCFVVIPVAIVPVYTSGVFLAPFLRIYLPIVLSFALMGFIYRLPPLKIRKLRIKFQAEIFWFCFWAIFFASYAYIFAVFGRDLRFANFFSSDEVYAVRLSARELSSGGLIGYILMWCSKVLNPFVIAYGLYSRRYGIVGIGLLGQIILYCANALKATLVSLFVVIGLFIVVKKRPHRLGIAILITLVCIVAIAGLLDQVLNTHTFVSLLNRRQIFLHGILTEYYFDFFSVNPKAHMGYSRLIRNYVNYPYDDSPSFVIGQVYFHSSSTNANENFWASAYADFGYLGLFVEGIIVSLILWVCDSLSYNLPLEFSSAFLFNSLFSLTGTSLFTSVITHGILLACLLLWVMPGMGRGDALR